MISSQARHEFLLSGYSHCPQRRTRVTPSRVFSSNGDGKPCHRPFVTPVVVPDAVCKAPVSELHTLSVRGTAVTVGVRWPGVVGGGGAPAGDSLSPSSQAHWPLGALGWPGRGTLRHGPLCRAGVLVGDPDFSHALWPLPK